MNPSIQLRPNATLVAAAVVCLGAGAALAQIKSFPQAEGFGAAALGGRGGDVYHVTKLTDDGSVGTLRHGIESATSSGRTIVFDVAGWIDLNSKLGIVKEKSKITIAGQTAPGGGIGVRGNQFSIGGDHVVIRHMRFRPGKGAGRVDSTGANVDAQYVIFDHVSAGFSYDENFSTQAQDLTLQYSTVSYGLEDHSAGSLIEQAYRLSMHHNLYAHNNTRNPKARVNETLDWIDNVVYDYNNGFIAGDSDTNDYFWTANFDGNYYITGPGDTGRPMIRDGHAQNYGLYFGSNAYDSDGDTTHDGRVYIGNGVDAGGLGSSVSGSYTWASAPYPTPAIWKDASPQAAYERVLSEFGATPWQRDEVDTRLYEDVVNRTGGLISRESELVGISNGGFGTLAAGAAPLDTDRDGMPDYWELKYGLPVAVASNNDDFDNDGYTDLEEYLNDLAAFKAIGPLEFTRSGRYADWNNWSNRWEPSRVDDVHVNMGTATVDAVGQRAGNLVIGAHAGNNATLDITSGWLEVTDDVTIGGDPTATAVLNLVDGVLSAKRLVRGAGGEFHFDGGTLHADTVDFDLTVDGSTLSPGHSIGTTHVVGDLMLNEGVLEIEIGGTGAGEFDRVEVDGVTHLGGILSVKFIDLGDGTYTPQLGDLIPFLASQGGTGEMFDDFELPELGSGMMWAIQPGDVATFLAVVPVPEPASMLLVVLGSTILATIVRRPRQAD